MVNRIWQHHFGSGIVRTASDFGRNGERPSHPELLDWLAVRFVESGWDIKKLHKVILLSSTYRQAAENPRADAARDPDNHLLWRSNRTRLEAEAIREVDEAADYALSSPFPAPETAVTDVYAPSEWNADGRLR